MRRLLHFKMNLFTFLELFILNMKMVIRDGYLKAIRKYCKPKIIGQLARMLVKLLDYFYLTHKMSMKIVKDWLMTHLMPLREVLKKKNCKLWKQLRKLKVSQRVIQRVKNPEEKVKKMKLKNRRLKFQANQTLSKSQKKYLILIFLISSKELWRQKSGVHLFSDLLNLKDWICQKLKVHLIVSYNVIRLKMLWREVSFYNLDFAFTGSKSKLKEEL